MDYVPTFVMLFDTARFSIKLRTTDNVDKNYEQRGLALA